MKSTQESPNPLSERQLDDYAELKQRHGHTPDELARLQDYRCVIAAGYAGHSFPADPSEDTQEDPQGPRFFIDGESSSLTYREASGHKLDLIRRRIFGETAAERATAARQYQRLFYRRRRPTSMVTPRTDRRTHVRSRERRDGSRRHSTRGGTNDPDGEPEPPGESPERPCACGCGRDISHKRRDSLTFDSACRMRVLRQQRELERTLADERDNEQRLAYRAVQPNCRCNGSHLLGEDGTCVKCGRPYRDDIPPYYRRLWQRMERTGVRAEVVWEMRSNGACAARTQALVVA